MRICTFNVNGIRSWSDHYKTVNAAIGGKKTTFTDVLNTLQSDIICVQETKANDASKITDPGMMHPPEYTAIYGFPRRPKKIGHAGVALFTRVNPVYCVDSMFDAKITNCFEFANPDDFDILKSLDQQGRFMLANFGPDLTIINVYCPNDGCEGDNVDLLTRQEERRVFYSFLEQMSMNFADSRNLIILGDFNVSAHPLDHCDYANRVTSVMTDDFVFDYLQSNNGKEDVKVLSEFYSDKPMRKWFFEWTMHANCTDCFRLSHPMEGKRYTCWNTKVSARQSNHGTRIDTILLFTKEHLDVKEMVVDCDLMSDYMGSDHCPVWLDLSDEKIKLQKSGNRKYSSQLKLTNFFTPVDNGSGSLDGVKRDKKVKILEDSNLDSSSKNVIEDEGSITIPDPISTACTTIGSSTLPPQEESSHCCRTDTTITDDDPVNKVKQAEEWSLFFLQNKERVPVCTGHNLPCKRFKVSKKGPNLGKFFYTCSVPVPDRCDYFKWA